MSAQTEWFAGRGVDEHVASQSMLFDAMIAALFGWALIMCAIATALRATVRR